MTEVDDPALKPAPSEKQKLDLFPYEGTNGSLKCGHFSEPGKCALGTHIRYHMRLQNDCLSQKFEVYRIARLEDFRGEFFSQFDVDVPVTGMLPGKFMQ